MNRILRCPDCNTPLVPGSSSCIKCNKQFSKPIPKVAEPKPAEPPIVPISVTPIAAPLKSGYKPQSKVLSATVLTVVCLIALVTFVVNQSQANERQALAQKQSYQQVLQNRTQLQQPPAPISMPAPVVMTAPSPKPMNYANGSDGSSSGSNPPVLESNQENAGTPDSQNNTTQPSDPYASMDAQVDSYYSDGLEHCQQAQVAEQGMMQGYAKSADGESWSEGDVLNEIGKAQADAKAIQDIREEALQHLVKQVSPNDLNAQLHLNQYQTKINILLTKAHG